jgi:long-chain acyl-CoA synthetase
LASSTVKNGGFVTAGKNRPIWERHYPVTARDLLPPEPRALTALLDEAKHAFPDRPCLTLEDWTLNYGEVAQLVARLGAGLAQLDFRMGDRIGYMGPPHPLFTLGCFAMWHIGAVYVGLNPLYSADRLARQCLDSGLKAIITLDEPGLLAKAHEIRELIGQPCQLLVASFRQDPRQATETNEPFGQGNIWAIANLLAADASVERATFDPVTQPAVLQFTGGTTGTPKAAVLTHFNLLTNAAQMVSWYPRLKPGCEVMLSAAPVTHAGGIGPVQNFTVQLAGELVSLPRFDPMTTLDLIEKRKITILLMAPTMAIALLEAARERSIDWSGVKCVQCGAGPVPAELKARFLQATGHWITTLYGMSETAPAVVYSPPDRMVAECTGVPLPFTEIEIRKVDDPHQRVAAGEVGEICLRGPQVMKEYWRNREATSEAFVDGFFRSGDLGLISEDGLVTVSDRLKDIIIAGGYNIYPADVENAILGHPAVREVAVIGVPDEYRGETAKAIVSLRGEERLDLDELKKFLSGRLSPMEIPTILSIVDEIPRNENMKISRLDLRELERLAPR